MIWTFRETRDCETAVAMGAGFRAVAQDCDGDFTWWEIKRGGRVIAKGQEIGFEPYHFDAARIAAENAVRLAAQELIAARQQ